MREALGTQDLPAPNLFTPDFGQDPHLMVGRDELVRSLRQGLASGPRDRRFTSVLVGPRGSGKTVVLNLARDIAHKSGWIVLMLDAATDGIHERLRDFIVWAQDTHDEIPDITGEPHREVTTIGVRALLGEWQRQIVREVNPQWSLRRQLTTLAQHAARRDVSVLLVLDELHSGERSELRRLSADMQHITKSESLPLAFLGAGLGELDHTLLEDRKMTFFRRSTRYTMPPIKTEDASRFLAQTIQDANGTITEPALQQLVDATGSLPHKMQLLGHCAWLAANAPFNTIDEQAATASVSEAARLMDSHVAEPTWNALSSAEQEFLSVLATHGGTLRLEEISAHLNTGTPSRRIASRLAHHGCVQLSEEGRCAITDLIPIERVRNFIEAHLGSDGTAALPSGTQLRYRCNEYMPRAQAKCILRRGHAGGHRSK